MENKKKELVTIFETTANGVGNWFNLFERDFKLWCARQKIIDDIKRRCGVTTPEKS